MRRFTDLYLRLDATTRTTEKVSALVEYFREAPREDAAWALALLTGRRRRRAVSTTNLRRWAAEATSLPLWLIEESYMAVGDLSETLALLLPENEEGTDEPLHELFERRLLPLAKMTEEDQNGVIAQAWRDLGSMQRLVFHKLISGGFRVGAQTKIVVRALAEVTGLEPGVVAHRLGGEWSPTAEDYERLLDPEAELEDPARPYPFFLASPLERRPDTLGEPADWLIEWKWDGVRAQIIRRDGRTLVWSRGEELVGESYPELRALGEALPDGVVLDGEIVAWENDRPLPFAALQRRIGRKQVQAMLFTDVPVVFMAFDLLERDGEDLRDEPVEHRRAKLSELVEPLAGAHQIRLSEPIEAPSWEALDARREEARERRVEGLILKRRGSPYRVGRVRGDWWKWKVDPFSVDCVLTHAQPGHGKRATLFTDYTFSVWENGELVPVTKAYSGLTDAEIDRVDAFVRRNTVARMGPVRAVKPEHVFELHFEGIQESGRHKSGIALRFPRMARWRTDKKIDEADTLETLRRLLDLEKQRASVS